ncbi:hypothetical protein [Agrobacterium cavarae]|uniref:hypothetical protein n=1 Tax=Agrobacterium cavarae TaxID=2528239 RepID=UPI003FD23B20
MTLSSHDVEYIAATAAYHPDDFSEEFSAVSATVRRGAIPSLTRRATGVIVGDISSCGPRPILGVINGGMPFVAGAMVAATLAFSPPSLASETRPRTLKSDTLRPVAEVGQASKLKAAMERLDRLASKHDGWKGPESVRMPEGVKLAANNFLAGYYSDEDVLDPFIGLDADGDVTLFWKYDNIRMDLSISEDGRYSFYAETNGEAYEANDVDAVTPLPSIVKAQLKKIVS